MSDWQERALAAHKAKEEQAAQEWTMKRRRLGALMAPLLRAIVGQPALEVEFETVELDGWTFHWPMTNWLYMDQSKPPNYLEMWRELPGCGHVFRREYIRDAAAAGKAIADFERGVCEVCFREHLKKESEKRMVT